jgi:hypothetical protein
MLQQVHAESTLLYGSMLWYALLAVVAGVMALGRRMLPGWFWTLVRIGLIVVALQAAAGVLLFAGGARPSRALHVLYGLLVVAAGVIVDGLKPERFVRRTFAREMGSSEAKTVALICLTQAALLMRAWMTGTSQGP